MKRTILAALAALLTHPALARCGSLEVAPDAATAATVTGGGPRLHFRKDGTEAAACPSLAAACQGRAYVVPGDVVLTGENAGAFTCATFAGPTGVATSGWLPTAALTPLAGQAPADWTGRWRRVEAEIVIVAAGAALRVHGDATWGAMDPERVRRGGVNIGEIEAIATPAAGVLAFTAGSDATLPYDGGEELDCRAKLRRVGPYLVVADNGNCGGHNVSFSGLYRRG